MCGIAGIARADGQTASRIREDLQRMADVMQHRGPDDEGFHVAGSIGLAARRLSIIDLSGGHQPVHNEDETVWAVLNGEIYNFREIRKHLEGRGHRFRAGCDTEVLVHLYEEYGVDMTRHLRGIFGFAVHDQKRRSLLLGRDRLGVKPLYYSLDQGELVFGSEIKVLFESGRVTPRVDVEALGLLLTLGYVPAPWTLYAGVRKLPPSQTLFWRDGSASTSAYWEFPDGPEHGISSAEWERRFMAQMRDSVAAELVSDVPLGVMLSGGVDSAAITALTAQALDHPVSTFHIGFENDLRASEIAEAQRVADAVGTDHHVMTTDLEDGIDFLARVAWHMDEPISDLSALGFYRISRLAREHVTVALAGQGGDELLAGYPRYWIHRYARWASKIPGPVFRGLIQPAAEALPRAGLLKKAAKTLGHADLVDWYTQSISIPGAGLADRLIRRDLGDRHTPELLRSTVEGYRAGFSSTDEMSQLLMLDSRMALPDDLLVHFDKMSMANSLEVRVPLLDYPLVELCTRMPNELKLRGWTTKYVLRQGCRDILPRQTLHGPKKGFFGRLVNRWMRVEMRRPIEELLLSGDAACLDYLNRDVLHGLVADHMEGREDYGRQLMNIWMLELCLRMFVDGSLEVSSPDGELGVEFDRATA